MSELDKKEQQVSKLVEENNTQAAVSLLLELITAHSEAKNFVKAEALRDKLFEVDSMALNEIIRAAEIIEKEKSESIDDHHRKIWGRLYDSLSQEEANALYYAMEEKNFETDSAVFSEGDISSSLYFVNRGQLKLVFRRGKMESLLTSLGPGMIAGTDTFFSASICTSSLITLSPVTLSCLSRQAINDLESQFPGLEPKLREFCKVFDKTCDIVKKKGVNRRAYKRISIDGIVNFQLMNSAGTAIGNIFKGKISDVSRGGMSFYIRSANPKNAQLLLGRTLELKFILESSGGKFPIAEKGVVTGVISQMFNDYSIHICFNELLDQSVWANL